MTNNIVDFLKKSSKKFPNKTAIIEPFTTCLALNGENKITYSKLDEYTDKLASKIIEVIGTSNKQVPILIILPKGIDCLISFFAAAKSGNFYTLLGEDQPIERIEKVVNILKPKILVTSSKFSLEINIPRINIDDISSFNVNLIALNNKYANHIENNLLYVFFTSGSTGIPKGVSISHKSVINFSLWVQEHFNITENDSWANQGQLHFDLTIADVYTSLASGSTLHLLPNSMFAFPKKILDYLEKEKITTILWVPSIFVYFANTGAINNYKLENMRNAMFCGEVMPVKQLNIWMDNLKNTNFINLYGPTEATCACTYYHVDKIHDNNEILPIGKPCFNTELLVFDENLSIIENNMIGKRGELYLKGSCLSLGYYNDNLKTKENFIQNPLHNNFNDIVYKTGDIVAYDENGDLLCFGRVDSQIKYKGYRIELGEIESAINSHKDIKNVACIFKDEIICFYESDINIDLKLWLKDKILSYMIPTKIIRLDGFKLNQNGKIDRKYLKENY